MRGVTRPDSTANVHVIQDTSVLTEEEKVHDRSINTTTTAKPVQSARAAKRAKLAAPEEGTLAKESVVKLDTTLCKLVHAARTMEEQLICAAVNAPFIAPLLVSQFTAVKCGVDAERAAIQMYKENNREDYTPKICSDAIALLASARQSFKVLTRMLSAVKPATKGV